MRLPSILFTLGMPAQYRGLCKMLGEIPLCPACAVPRPQLTTQIGKALRLTDTMGHMLAFRLTHVHETSAETPFPYFVRIAASTPEPACSPAGAMAGATLSALCLLVQALSCA